MADITMLILTDHDWFREQFAKLDDLQAKLNMAQSNKEYQLLKDQMAADKQANSVLADEILERARKQTTDADITYQRWNLNETPLPFADASFDRGHSPALFTALTL